MHGKDEKVLLEKHNTARFFVENRQIALVLLLAVFIWGAVSYFRMPQRKDPDIPMRVAAVTCTWPGASAEKVEDLVTRRLEERIAENDKVDRIESTTRTGLAVVIIKLYDDIQNPSDVFDDLNLKLASVTGLPDGAGPVNFMKDFGDTATLMLTVASPLEGEVELSLRARQVEQGILELRGAANATSAGNDGRVTLVEVLPASATEQSVRRKVELFARLLADKGLASDVRTSFKPGLALLDARTDKSDAEMLSAVHSFVQERLRASEFHPDAWPVAIVRDPAKVMEALAPVAGSRYGFRDLEAYTDEIMRTLQTLPEVSRVNRWGVRDEAVYLNYSQERLAAYGFGPWQIKEVLAARNTRQGGGVVEAAGKSMLVDPSGELTSEDELGGVAVGRAKNGALAYLRDMVDIEGGYLSPPTKRHYHVMRDAHGAWARMPAVTLAITMRKGEQIAAFSKAVDATLSSVSKRLPADLVLSRTSDQPQQVADKVDLFMTSLYEAIILVVLVALIGFREWRSALLMALSIPITLAMTFGLMNLLGLDIQQVSLAALILALGLLVDDPVVANDAIKLELRSGKSGAVAAWLGPTKLAKAILYATITNIVAYLPYLMLSGDKGRFLYSLPMVIACSLVASRVVSMTFIPFIGQYLLRPGRNAGKTLADLRSQGFTGRYYRLASSLIDHRWKAMGVSLVIVLVAFAMKSQLKDQFFPYDLSHLAYVDVWLPEDASVLASETAAAKAQELIGQAAAQYAKDHPKSGGPGRQGDGRVLKTMTTFIGAGGPRFWFSVTPELGQPNYAQILLEINNVHDTQGFMDYLQPRLTAAMPGVQVSARRLESGPPVGIPVQLRLSGDDIPMLRAQAEKLKNILRDQPDTDRVQDNWGAEIFRAHLKIDPDKAALAGVTNQDVARSSAAAMNGFQVTSMRQGRIEVPVFARLRMEERAGMEDIKNLYVSTLDGASKVPLGQISTVSWGLETEKIARRNHFRTITVSCFTAPGVLSSEIIQGIRPKLDAFTAQLPPGYKVEIGGEYEEQTKGFGEMGMVMAVSILAIYLALLFQFKNGVKPLIVFAAVPYGMAGAFGALYLAGAPFGFMAYLGIVSLMGVIVSHIIVLFDFIEERRAEGDDLRMAILDAGIMRLRPVMITVAATVTALIPLALHGGPLWEPLCYAQIGGLTVATFVTLLMVPVIYSIAAFDLKIVS
ncbi:MAG: AcrB/AcrD/AcrF family protein [Deltaproteobacteria bacterium HGW-Deltaproteobacteria-8]|jgi:multidrug efflux pump subunit AcrB|nr:MAG: AcrB/AcrD/AcrF family protein [Deltaproteobacteria bacterium HGW-Deltaproteobacteria-8]